MVLLGLIYVYSLLVLCNAAIHEHIRDLPRIAFDYIIVGGGVGGSVLAGRLSETPGVQVLLIEAGGSTSTPDYASKDMWNYTTVPQAGLNGASTEYLRGFSLGGSSTINRILYARGSSDDYDRYAEVTQDAGWSWSNLVRYFERSQRLSVSAKPHNASQNIGTYPLDGDLHLSVPEYTSSLEGASLQSSKQGCFQYSLDFGFLGLAHKQATIDRTNRTSAANPRLLHSADTRSNLHILVHARVSRVLATKLERGVRSFRAVELAHNLAGPFHRLEAKHEVILSAGTIGTPQILLNSGIGNTTYLKSVGIPPVVHLPGVGQNLSDQTTTATSFSSNPKHPYDSLYRNPELMTATLQRVINGTGSLVPIPGAESAWFRLNQRLIKRLGADPASGDKSPHLEFVFGHEAPTTKKGKSLFNVQINLVTPVARGSVQLNRTTRSPFNYPLIDPGFFTDNFDIRAIREGIKDLISFVNAPVMRGYLLSSTGNLTTTSTDAEIEAYIRRASGTSQHPVGTASMSPKGAKYGVVDPDLRVKNVRGLRIVDASVLPYSTSANPQSTVYVFAERAANMIKAAKAAVMTR